MIQVWRDSRFKPKLLTARITSINFLQRIAWISILVFQWLVRPDAGNKLARNCNQSIQLRVVENQTMS
jgi:hypothetical protein